MKCRTSAVLLLFSCAVALHGCKRTQTAEPREVEQHAFAREIPSHIAEPAPAPPPEPAAQPTSCPAGMILVEGEHCPEVEHKCLRWLDPPGKWRFFRCAEYAKQATCKKPRVHKKFCIDANEAGATPTDPRPANHVSYKMANAACTARGARLCLESEFEFACEGEELRPYPYGFKRDPRACNVDREDVVTPNKKAIYDLRRTPAQTSNCASPFGVMNLAGNVEEWVTRDRPTLHTKSTLLKGSWWLKGKHTCRATNGGHDDWYQGTETGYRCCADAR